METQLASEAKDQVKARGGHYTPPGLADFLAANILEVLSASKGPIRVLDPACGDGSLLAAIAKVANPSIRKRLHLVGLDTHHQAIRDAREALTGIGAATLDLRVSDFLVECGPWGSAQGSLLLDPAPSPAGSLVAFDAVIANPPYVRTQVLGAARAQYLAQRFGLSGRVDLYHAFLRAIALSLRPSGILGLLTSNRFLVTQAGATMRESLVQDFDLIRAIDLGDTKLFSAAVLPAIAIARRGSSMKPAATTFVRVYETRGATASSDAPLHTSVLGALASGAEGLVRVGALLFNVERGTLSVSDDSSHPWVLKSRRTDEWGATVTKNTACTFGDVARIRVGIKTTADPIFIRTDWESLHAAIRPEAVLLRPLLTHRVASAWKATIKDEASPRVLYTHTTEHGKRVPIDLAKFPRAEAYLESHREQLGSRKYVTDAGRRWYEIWVPQQPADWARRKVVFPDISETPRFFLDDLGAVVNGDCYWITLLPGKSESWLFLMLAVANSRFIERYYDTMFNNRLYAGRRRFLTQYVARFPLPDLNSALAQEAIRLARERTAESTDISRMREIEVALDHVVPRLFGLVEEIDRQRDLQLAV